MSFLRWFINKYKERLWFRIFIGGTLISIIISSFFYYLGTYNDKISQNNTISKLDEMNTDCILGIKNLTNTIYNSSCSTYKKDEIPTINFFFDNIECKTNKDSLLCHDKPKIVGFSDKPKPENCSNAMWKNDINFTLKEGTLSFFFKPDWLKPNGISYLLDMVDYNNQSILEVFVVNNKTIKLTMWDSNNIESDIGYPKPSLGDWEQIIITWSGEKGFVKLYINGELVGSVQTHINFDRAIRTFYVYSSHESNFCSFGGFNRLAMYKKPLNKYEVIHHYDNGAGCYINQDNALLNSFWHIDGTNKLITCDKHGTNWYTIKRFFKNLF